MNRLKETNIANNGQKMTIIAFRSCYDLDVQFEDGTIVRNKTYTNFKSGLIRNPNIRTYNFNDRTGERKQNQNGDWMEIIAYRSYIDIDVRFDNNVIVYNKRYQEFKSGKIFFRGNHLIGMRVKNSKGLDMELIKYNNSRSVVVRFDDGSTKEVTYYNFKRGTVSHPNNIRNSKDSLLNSTVKLKSGETVKIINVRSVKDLDIQFEDGTIRENVSYGNLIRAGVRKYNLSDFRLMEHGISKSGVRYSVSEYINATNLIVQFEDGTKYQTTYSAIARGTLGHPTLRLCKNSVCKDSVFGTFNVLKIAYRASNEAVNYICQCKKCSYKDILTPSEMLKHKC